MNTQVRRGIVAVWLVISQVPVVLSLIPWLALTCASVMLFDSGYDPQAQVVFFLFWMYPLLFVVCAAASWLLLWRERLVLASVSTTPPLLTLALVLTILSIGW